MYIVGAGRDGVCARALARLIGTVGVLPADDATGSLAELRGYLLSTYAISRTARDGADWLRLRRVAEELRGRDETPATVRFLGLWDTRGVPGVPRGACADSATHVETARHALAIDAHTSAIPFGSAADAHQQVWFRGAHGDITRARHSCAALSDIALDWVLDGAVSAGAELADPAGHQAPDPIDALAGSHHPVSPRRLPAGAAVHASVECYLRAHPAYWRRLPAQVEWADPDWVARGERLMVSPKPPRRLPRRTRSSARPEIDRQRQPAPIPHSQRLSAGIPLSRRAFRPFTRCLRRSGSGSAGLRCPRIVRPPPW